MDSIKLETRNLVRHAGVMIYIGEYDAAELLLLRALYNTHDCGELTEAGDYLPRIYHRMGQLEAGRGNVRHARELLTHADESFKADNVIGRAWTLRDLAWLTYRHGDREQGGSLARRARRLLKKPGSATPLWEKEFIVTDGYVARTDPQLPPADAVLRFLRIDERLRGGSDPIYERDNLKRLIGHVPLTDRVGFEFRSQVIWWRLIADHEIRTVTQDLMDGNIKGATLGSARRMTRHLLPF